jgi:hypothetical protein
MRRTHDQAARFEQTDRPAGRPTGQLGLSCDLRSGEHSAWCENGQHRGLRHRSGSHRIPRSVSDWGDYTRFSVGTTAANIDVGEDIRWLPRHEAPPDLPDDDWWLFDDALAAYTVFTADGAALPGWVAITDPLIVTHYARRRDALWSRAIPHTEYAK